MKLVLDMNLSPRWVAFLAQSGFEAVHWSTVGPNDAADAEIIAYARTNDSVLMTHDLDFSAILAATRGDKPSVVQLRADDTSPESVGNRVIAALKQAESALSEGALVSVDPKRARLRMLPLSSQS